MTIKKRLKVLIVEDDEYLREAIYLDLKMGGFEPYTACSGSEAVLFIKTTSVDIVLSDIQMPDGNGVQLLEELRKHNPTLPVVVLMTGYSDVLPAEAIRKGAFRVLIKPFARDILLKSLNEAALQRVV